MARFFSLFLLLPFFVNGQQRVPADFNQDIYKIASEVSADSIKKSVEKLVSFGTRNTLSDTVSSTRGIGAARRWIYQEFMNISGECNDCLDVQYQRTLVKGDAKSRIKTDTWIVNVLAIQKAVPATNRYIIVSGDIDSRASDATDDTTDAPGANDNASGMAGVIECARVLSHYSFHANIVFAGLSGEEQGLFGGMHLAAKAKEEGWDLIGVLNNDMIGNIEGVDGVIDNESFRIFSEPTPVTETEETRKRRRYFGGEIDGVSRQLARYVDATSNKYLTDVKPMMVYRLDRFGRGGHHKPFNDMGYAGVRIMETHENYNRQHQDIRQENGIEYGDVLSGVNFDYAAKLTRVNAVTLAALAWAPEQPQDVLIGGMVSPDTHLKWTKSDEIWLLGYKIYWRETTAPQWQHSIYVGNVDHYTLKNIVIDNYLFGVAAVGKDGTESVVSFPQGLIRD
ncbi:MAG: M28 family metallopeptidase [Cyclobacteriaceae bacterium]|nr:M28 family metallopeptidase [Cyclobacteriaceae bacterium]